MVEESLNSSATVDYSLIEESDICSSTEINPSSQTLFLQEELHTSDTVDELPQEDVGMTEGSSENAENEKEAEPFICPRDGCNKDLTKQSQHNRNMHIKWCGHSKKKAAMEKKRSSKEAAAFSSYFTKKPKVSQNNEIDFNSEPIFLSSMEQ